ncbi:hypothetical protein TNCV_3810011 [Trichonephila clavipes]|nr:hypothetical protein TNCV_3810011 [Trichonephila clavipes]
MTAHEVPRRTVPMSVFKILGAEVDEQMFRITSFLCLRAPLNIPVSCLLTSPRQPLTVRNSHSAHEWDVIRGVRMRSPHPEESRKECVEKHRRERLWPAHKYHILNRKEKNQYFE